MAIEDVTKYEITTNGQEIAEAFSEWDRRWREDPEKFMDHATRLLKGETPDTYGEFCAPYFIEIIEELRRSS